MFSATSRWGKSAYDWNTMEMPRRAGGSPVTSASPIVMRPDVSVSRPATRRSVVDLPQPDGPSSTTSVPTAASKLTSSTARVAPQDLVTRWREIAGIASARAGGRSAASRAK